MALSSFTVDLAAFFATLGALAMGVAIVIAGVAMWSLVHGGARGRCIRSIAYAIAIGLVGSSLLVIANSITVKP